MPVLFTLKMLSISNFLPALGPVTGTAACYEGMPGLRLKHFASKDASSPPYHHLQMLNSYAKTPSSR